MQYLYGDASPSPLERNYLTLVRDALELCAGLLLAGLELDDESERVEAHAQAADVELSRLAALRELLHRALADAVRGSANSPTARCAHDIEQSIDQHVRTEQDGVRSRLAATKTKIDHDLAAIHRRCVAALEEFLRRQDPPAATGSLAIKLESTGRYSARWHLDTPYALSATLALEIPEGHSLARTMRLDAIVERLDVLGPDKSGWIQKKVRLETHRLERYHLVRFADRVAGCSLALRAASDGSGDGFDLDLQTGESSCVRLVRLADDGSVVGDPMDLSAEDAAKIVGLRRRLQVLCEPVLAQRSAVVEAAYDDEPFDQVVALTDLVERIVQVMAPTVVEIARRSNHPDELVLKRLLSDGRREECFVSKRELRARIETVPEPTREVFAPLGLLDVPPPVPTAATRRSPLKTKEPRRVSTVPAVERSLEVVALDSAVLTSEPSILAVEPRTSGPVLELVTDASGATPVPPDGEPE